MANEKNSGLMDTLINLTPVCVGYNITSTQIENVVKKVFRSAVDANQIQPDTLEEVIVVPKERVNSQGHKYVTDVRIVAVLNPKSSDLQNASSNIPKRMREKFPNSVGSYQMSKPLRALVQNLLGENRNIFVKDNKCLLDLNSFAVISLILKVQADNSNFRLSILDGTEKGGVTLLTVLKREVFINKAKPKNRYDALVSELKKESKHGKKGNRNNMNRR